MKTIDDLEVAGRRVLLRADLNVPLDGRHADHRRRPDPGQPADADQQAARTGAPGDRPRAPRPAQGRPRRERRGGPSLRAGRGAAGRAARPARSRSPPTWPGRAAEEAAQRCGHGDVALLENVRFEPAETSKDDAERGAFAERLAALAELYVGDGFGAVHRKHASVYDLPGLLPHAAG